MDKQLTQEELACVLETLKQRGKWFHKALQQNGLKDSEKASYESKSNLLYSAVKKLGAMRSSAISFQSDTAAATPEMAEDEGKSKISTKKLDKTLQQLNVLVVDDDDSMRALMCRMLEELDIQHLDDAINGPSALSLLEAAEEPFDLLLCDWNMLEMSGLEVLKQLRTDERYQQLAFIMVTGRGDKEDLREAIRQGVDDYVVKPIDLKVLEGKIRKLVQG